MIILIPSYPFHSLSESLFKEKLLLINYLSYILHRKATAVFSSFQNNKSVLSYSSRTPLSLFLLLLSFCAQGFLKYLMGFNPLQFFSCWAPNSPVSCQWVALLSWFLRPYAMITWSTITSCHLIDNMFQTHLVHFLFKPRLSPCFFKAFGHKCFVKREKILLMVGHNTQIFGWMKAELFVTCSSKWEKEKPGSQQIGAVEGSVCMANWVGFEGFLEIGNCE